MAKHTEGYFSGGDKAASSILRDHLLLPLQAAAATAGVDVQPAFIASIGDQLEAELRRAHDARYERFGAAVAAAEAEPGFDFEAAAATPAAFTALRNQLGADADAPVLVTAAAKPGVTDLDILKALNVARAVTAANKRAGDGQDEEDDVEDDDAEERGALPALAAFDLADARVGELVAIVDTGHAGWIATRNADGKQLRWRAVAGAADTSEVGASDAGDPRSAGDEASGIDLMCSPFISAARLVVYVCTLPRSFDMALIRRWLPHLHSLHIPIYYQEVFYCCKCMYAAENITTRRAS